MGHERRKLLAADTASDRLLKSSPSGPTVGGSRRSRPLVGAGRHSLCARKAGKAGKMLSVMTRTPFLTFLTFLALGPQKKAEG
jgi:hypothetical protein